MTSEVVGLTNKSLIFSMIPIFVMLFLVTTVIIIDVEATENNMAVEASFDELEVADNVTLEVVKEEVIEEEVVESTGIKLEHKVGVNGEFEGKFDLTMINTTGEYYIRGEVDTFVLVGTFELAGIKHWNPLTGVYVTSNPNCQNIIGDLVLESKETKINLDFLGKNCKYGLISYVVGTFETSGSTGQYDIESGEGRITFVADHHSNNVSGQLKGSFE